VADKGLPAALYMTVARTLIRAGAANSRSPASVLEEVNRLLVNDSTDSMFITAIYAILSLEDGELLYSNAGHNLPLLYRHKTGAVEQLPKGGTALGILNDLKLEDHALKMLPGDTLLLFTDGVTDLLSPEGQFFGDERLIDIIRTFGKERVLDMLEALDDALIEFRRGTPPADDVTLLAIRREPARRTRRRNSQPSSDAHPAS
jgi:phosphoserine phosphatase RsbU/P